MNDLSNAVPMQRINVPAANQSLHAPAPVKLAARGLDFYYDKFHALKSINLEIPEKRVTALIGPSGCGKSTLLRMVAGLDTPTSGTIVLDGKPITGPGADRGMVFQSYTLFPWLTIAQNIRFGLRERGLGEAEQKERSDYFIAKVGLRGFEGHYP
ncbi:MAG TPA: ATP-binding cassette domain-containing protein, partial [Stenotrophomonas sp.]